VSPAGSRTRSTAVGLRRRCLARPLDGQSDKDVEDDDEGHWKHEQHERGQLEQNAGVGQPLGRHGADERVVQRTAVSRVAQIEVGACEERVRSGSHCGSHPHSNRRLQRTRHALCTLLLTIKYQPVTQPVFNQQGAQILQRNRASLPL